MENVLGLVLRSLLFLFERQETDDNLQSAQDQRLPTVPEFYSRKHSFDSLRALDYPSLK